MHPKQFELFEPHYARYTIFSIVLYGLVLVTLTIPWIIPSLFALHPVLHETRGLALTLLLAGGLPIQAYIASRGRVVDSATTAPVKSTVLGTVERIISKLVLFVSGAGAGVFAILTGIAFANELMSESSMNWLTLSLATISAAFSALCFLYLLRR
jgi:hypothetical protein